MTGKLYLIPTPISQENIAWALPSAVQQCIAEISHFIVEHPKTARQFLKQIDCKHSLQELSMQTLNEHTSPKDLSALLDPILAGHDVGL
jgi:16S rRNA (cytidine1402-2'-O)-methyltransferase